MAENNNGTANARGPGRPWPKGTSGNPGGRPRKLRDLEAALDEHRTVESLRDVFAKLRAMALEGDVQAMRLYLDRVMGPVRDPYDFENLLREAPPEVVDWLASLPQ